MGTMMSPSEGISHRFTTVFTSRWFIAIMIPLPGITSTSQPAIRAILPAQAPAALIVNPARISTSSPPRWSRTTAPRTARSSTTRRSTSW